MNKKFWLYLHPYVYLTVKSEHAVLYNTIDGNMFEYTPHDNPSIFRLLKRLNSNRRLYVIGVEGKELHGEVNDFIGSLKDHFMGDIIDTSARPKKPIQLKPILSLQNTIDFAKPEGDENLKQLVQDQIKDYLNVLTLYINRRCQQNCPMCIDAHKQFPCCTKGGNNDKRALAIPDLQLLLKEIEGCNLHKLNIIGGNLLEYPEITPAAELLNSYPVLKIYYLHYLNLEPNDAFFGQLENTEYAALNILVHFPLQQPIDRERLENKLNILNRYVLKKKFSFIIMDAAQITAAEEIVDSFGLTDYEFIPYNNGDNRDFFNEYVYISREDLGEAKPDLKEILTRTCLNTYNFKKLTIKSNKAVHANLNTSMLGKLGQDHILDLIHKEINNGNTWTRVRRHVAPCKSCAFNVLCPPISNYELAENKYNGCTIRH